MRLCVIPIMATFVHGAIGKWQGWLRKDTDCLQNGSLYLIDYWSPPLLMIPCDEHLHETQVCSHPLPIQRDLSTYFLNVFLTNFQTMLFPSPWHPANPLATAHESLNNCTSGHFSHFQTKYMTMCTSLISDHCEDFLLPVSFRVVPERDYKATLSRTLQLHITYSIISKPLPCLFLSQ